MATITLKIKQQIVLTEATIPIVFESACIKTYFLDVLVPGSPVFVEIIASDGYGVGAVVEEQISVLTNYEFSIDAWTSTYAPQNTINSTMTLNVRSSAGGTILTTIILDRDHSAVNC